MKATNKEKYNEKLHKDHESQKLQSLSEGNR